MMHIMNLLSEESLGLVRLDDCDGAGFVICHIPTPAFAFGRGLLLPTALFCLSMAFNLDRPEVIQ